MRSEHQHAHRSLFSKHCSLKNTLFDLSATHNSVLLITLFFSYSAIGSLCSNGLEKLSLG